MTVGLARDSRFLREAISVTARLVGVWLGLLAVRARYSASAGLARSDRTHDGPEGPEFRGPALEMPT